MLPAPQLQQVPRDSCCTAPWGRILPTCRILNFGLFIFYKIWFQLFTGVALNISVTYSNQSLSIGHHHQPEVHVTDRLHTQRSKIGKGEHACQCRKTQPSKWIINGMLSKPAASLVSIVTAFMFAALSEADGSGARRGTGQSRELSERIYSRAHLLCFFFY